MGSIETFLPGLANGSSNVTTGSQVVDGGGDLAADQGAHGGLDVVPHVGLGAGAPRDRPVGLLGAGDRARGRRDLLGAQHARQRRELRRRRDRTGTAHVGLRR